MTKRLSELIRLSVEAVKCMSPKDRLDMLEEQKRSWVRGEMGIGSDADEAEYRRALRENDKLALAVLDGEAQKRMRRMK